tara:strand:- start:5370 stop:6593 length:1224 start_codon:yes stop_codon:yes gene_type:complete
MVRTGYKQTIYGDIPVDWDVKVVDEIASINTGDKNTQDKIEDGAFPFFVRSQIVEAINSYSFDGEAVLTAGDGVGTGKIFHYINGKFDYHQRVYNIHDFKTGVNGFYFYKFFSRHFYDRIMSMTAKSSVDSVRREMIADMEIVLPSETEQEAIAKALSDVDELIVSLEKLIAKKRDIKTATMQQLLTGKKRLPGFDKSWSLINMGIDANLNARIGWQALTTKEYLESGEFYLVTGTDFIDGRVHWNSCHFVDEWRYSQDRNIQLKEGDVLLTKDGTIGKVGYVENLHMPATLNSGVFVIRTTDNKFHPLFLFYILNSRVFDDFLSKITAGSTITHLYQKDFVNFEFLSPELDEQIEISNFLQAIDKDLAAQEYQLKKVKDIKQGMMQELLTGRTRLIDPAELETETA